MNTAANLSPALLDALVAIVGEDKVKTEPADLLAYGQDWTRSRDPAPSAIVLPKTTEQVQKLVKLANTEGVALVPSGGRTGLSGGAVAANGEIVVAFLCAASRWTCRVP